MLKTRAGKIIGNVPADVCHVPADVGADVGADVCLDAMQLRVRYGNRSHMWIVRLLKDDPGFPRPLLIRNRRYWRLSEIELWEESKRQKRSATHAA
jgi:hypothetical protein